MTSLQLLRLLNIGKWTLILFIAYYVSQVLEKRKQILEICIFLGLIIALIVSAKVSFIKTLGILFTYILILYLLFSKKRLVVTLISFAILILFLTLNFSDFSALKKYQKSYLSSNHLTKNQISLSNFIKENTSDQSLFLAPHSFASGI